MLIIITVTVKEPTHYCIEYTRTHTLTHTYICASIPSLCN